MKLEKLLDKCRNEFRIINEDKVESAELKREITLITDDSRKAGPDSIFTAICGARRDGHDFLGDIRNKGCSCAIVEKEHPEIPVIQIVSQNSRIAWSRISALYYDEPAKDMKVLGITATNGKTTISFMLDEILRAEGLLTGLIGTVKIRYGDEVVASRMTTPEPFELQGYFAKMRDKGIKTVVMEVSSSALEQHRAHDIPFSVVSFNNFSREHIDQHGTLEKYWMAKSSIIRDSKENTVNIINVDDKEIRKLKGAGAGHQITYSVESRDGDIYVEDLDLSSDSPQYSLVIKDDIILNDRVIKKGKIRIALSVPGYHTVKNSVCCAAMALAYGCSEKSVAVGLKAFSGVERRFELIYDRGFRILDDHYANPDNIKVTLDSISKMKYGKLHMVYAIRGNRGTTVNRENIEETGKWLNKLHLGSFTGTETLGLVTKKDLVSDDEKAVFFEETRKLGIEPEFFPKMDEALSNALRKAQDGDIILLAGCQGMDMGARLILSQLSEKFPEDSEKIKAPLKYRVCGN